jgi:hypothetical protein
MERGGSARSAVRSRLPTAKGVCVGELLSSEWVLARGRRAGIPMGAGSARPFPSPLGEAGGLGPAVAGREGGRERLGGVIGPEEGEEDRGAEEGRSAGGVGGASGAVVMGGSTGGAFIVMRAWADEMR